MVPEGPLLPDEGLFSPLVPPFWLICEIRLCATLKADPVCVWKVLIVKSGTTLSRNNPVPKEAEKVLKKIQALIVYIGEL